MSSRKYSGGFGFETLLAQQGHVRLRRGELVEWKKCGEVVSVLDRDAVARAIFDCGHVGLRGMETRVITSVYLCGERLRFGTVLAQFPDFWAMSVDWFCPKSLIYKEILVGVRGFEPPASTSRT